MGLASFFGRSQPEPQRGIQPIDAERLSLLTDWFLDRKIVIANYDGKLVPNTFPSTQKDDGLTLVLRHRPRDPALSLFDLEIIAFNSPERHIRFQLPENFTVAIVRVQEGIEYDHREALTTSGMFNSILIRSLDVGAIYQFKSPGLTSGQPAFAEPINPNITDVIETIESESLEAFEPYLDQPLSQHSMPARRNFRRHG